ncbi:MAG: OmpA family protein [Alphaproteobacteria bacterium]|nr:OmpA family protein [Alphaproteobacteria bacterium]
MTMTRAFAGAFVSLGFVFPAFAADGFYVSLDGGASAVSDWEHTRTKWTVCGPVLKDAVATFDTGWAAFGSAGYTLGQWRVEVEGGYRHNEIASYVKEGWNGQYLVREGGSHPLPSGELSEASAMLNLLYDVPLFERFSLSVGLGAGADYTSFKLATAWAPVDEGAWHFAYQGLAGLNFALTEVTTLFVAYRYANVSDIHFQPTSTVQLDGEDFEKQAATAGVRFAFAAPAAPAAAPPEATPGPVPLEREFIVFFGFNKWSLSPAALSTIREAVGAVHKSGSANIRVVGHADRAGSIAYNKALSVHRAQSVRKALIGEGLAPTAISVSGRGESEPQVPTADGVREPQNRRAHISF